MVPKHHEQHLRSILMQAICTLLNTASPALWTSNSQCARSAAATPRTVHRQDGAIATKLVIWASKCHAREAQHRQRACTHDAGLARHVQLTPAEGKVTLCHSSCTRVQGHTRQCRRLMRSQAMQAETCLSARSCQRGSLDSGKVRHLQPTFRNRSERRPLRAAPTSGRWPPSQHGACPEHAQCVLAVQQSRTTEKVTVLTARLCL